MPFIEMKSEGRTGWQTGKRVVGQKHSNGHVNLRCPLGFQVVLLNGQLGKWFGTESRGQVRDIK